MEDKQKERTQNYSQNVTLASKHGVLSSDTQKLFLARYLPGLAVSILVVTSTDHLLAQVRLG